MSHANFNQLINSFKPIIGTIVYKIMNKMPDSTTIQRDDLVQAGMIGLFDAAQNSRVDLQSKQFSHYAGTRIHGAIMDEIRLNDFVSRSIRDSIKTGNANEYTKVISNSGNFLDVDDYDFPDTDDPLYILIDEEEKRLINDAAEQCEPRDRITLDMLYNEGITKREAAERLGVHETRINQLNKRAINKIKEQICS